MNRKALRGSLLLLLGAVIWGAAFAAQRAGMDHVQPFTFTGVRMLLAGLVMIPASAIARRKNGAEMTPERARDQRRGGALCGILLFTATSLQQIGLVYTSAGKAGFITALYVVLVPMAAWLLFRKQPGRVIWAAVGIAVAALYLLCVPAEGFQLERGDAMLLGCAVTFTAQILCVDHYAPRVDGFTLAMSVALATEEIRMEGILEAAFPILYAGILSGAVGYTIQIVGQRDVNPTIASLLMCLESVFAVLTGAVFLGERMTGKEAAGCLLMFTAVILAQLSTLMKKKKTAKEQ